MNEIERVARAMEAESEFCADAIGPTNMRKLATAAIAAMREEPVGWQPIETAPKDDAEYLVSNDRGQFVVWFDPDWTDGGWWMVSDGKDCERPLRGRTPTHWMPLPTPPASGKD